MIRPIVRIGHEALRTRAREVGDREFDSSFLRDLIADMEETLRAAGGVGLAAPQVGTPLRVILVEGRAFGAGSPVGAGEGPDGETPEPPPIVAYINPRIVDRGGETVAGWEGCLSFPETMVRVARPRRVRIEAVEWSPHEHERRETTFEVSDFAARVFCHEIDHLDGILTIDHAESPEAILPAPSGK